MSISHVFRTSKVVTSLQEHGSKTTFSSNLRSNDKRLDQEHAAVTPKQDSLRLSPGPQDCVHLNHVESGRGVETSSKGNFSSLQASLDNERSPRGCLHPLADLGLYADTSDSSNISPNHAAFQRQVEQIGGIFGSKSMLTHRTVGAMAADSTGQRSFHERAENEKVKPVVSTSTSLTPDPQARKVRRCCYAIIEAHTATSQRADPPRNVFETNGSAPEVRGWTDSRNRSIGYQ